MISFKDTIDKFKLTTKPFEKAHSKRADLLGQLYEYYERCYIKEMEALYSNWLLEKKNIHSIESGRAFKKTSQYRTKITMKSFCGFWLSHIPTEDIYYLISIARDKEHRGESFNRWLFWAIKV